MKPKGLMEWLYFPHYQGFNLEHITKGDFIGKSWAEAASFVQRWAYFGMIAEVLAIGGFNMTIKNGGEVDESKYKATKWFGGGNDETFPGNATTKEWSQSLPDLILMWQNNETDNVESSKMEHLGEIYAILKRVREFVEVLYNNEQNGKNVSTPAIHVDDDKDYTQRRILQNKPEFFSDEPGCEHDRIESPGHALIISIEVAGELLGRAASQIYDRKIPLKWPPSITVTNRLHLAGWCDFEIKKLADEGSMIRSYYLSFIQRGPISRHDHCCTLGCVANQINKVTYKTKHAKENCECAMVSFELGEKSTSAAWIRAGHTGVIVRNSQQNGGLSVWDFIESHHTSDRPKKYVAISHVWSDGTGNAEGNALPSCQLSKFQDAANELYDPASPPIPFWIDTVCVPSGGDLKKLAIRQMEKVYRDADKVLVFDSGLQRTSTSAAPSECITQIEICSWNERLWTIQEAAFARTLYFQFKDGIEDVQSLQVRYRETRFERLGEMLKLTENGDLLQMALIRQLQPVLTIENFLSKMPCDIELAGLALDAVFWASSEAVGGFLNVLRLPVEEEMSLREKWDWLQNVLPYRQTSIASDEGLCLGTLLGMDVSELYDLPDEERVVRMFLHVGVINGGLIFGPRPRIQKPGYGWMPSTFVSQSIAVQGPDATVTKTGLEVTFPGISVTFPPKGFMFQHDGGDFGFLELDDEDGPGYLLASKFGLRDAKSGELYAVTLYLPKDSGGLIASGRSGSIIILEKPLGEKEPLYGILASSMDRQHMEYAAPMLITKVLTFEPHFLSACASATHIEEKKWLVS